ncbi:hypothetical protein [Hydrogenovibrio kuenenii]|uniref:hypothetical protein n=1 Tax=Hydrogenovibrio kuenenii TaxID=63658 RepID=UPI000463A0E7|nr:hypothetical protein [Hydrogenovibrio kuenenii]
MNGYPKGFLISLITVSLLLIITGLLLIPAFLVFRLEQEQDWLMNLSIASGNLRQNLTVFHAIFGWTMVWFIGALWSIHIRSHWRKHENRINGIAFLIIWAVLIISALGIYYFGTPDWSKTSSIIHVLFGVIVPFMLIAHKIIGKKTLKKPNRK